MPEKRRWFDPKNKRAVPTPLPLPSPLLNTAQLAQADVEEFLLAIQSRCDSGTWALFATLSTHPSRVRLGRNLKVLLDCLIDHPVTSIMCDGLRKDEQEALIDVEKLGLAMPLRVTAQALLNVNERYQLALALGSAFT